MQYLRHQCSVFKNLWDSKMCGGFMGKWANLSPQPNLTYILRYGIVKPIFLPSNTQLNLTISKAPGATCSDVFCVKIRSRV